MSKKSRRQRQQSKQRNYAQLYNQPAKIENVPEKSQPTNDQTVSHSPTPASTALLRMQHAKNADLWDSLIFAGAIFVVFIALYYINLKNPVLDQFGTWVMGLMNFTF